MRHEVDNNGARGLEAAPRVLATTNPPPHGPRQRLGVWLQKGACSWSPWVLGSAVFFFRTGFDLPFGIVGSEGMRGPGLTGVLLTACAYTAFLALCLWGPLCVLLLAAAADLGVSQAVQTFRTARLTSSSFSDERSRSLERACHRVTAVLRPRTLAAFSCGSAVAASTYVCVAGIAGAEQGNAAFSPERWIQLLTAPFGVWLLCVVVTMGALSLRLLKCFAASAVRSRRPWWRLSAPMVSVLPGAVLIAFSDRLLAPFGFGVPSSAVLDTLVTTAAAIVVIGQWKDCWRPALFELASRLGSGAMPVV